MTPTQEAAAKAIEAATISLKDFSKWSEVAATAALTAAAEAEGLAVDSLISSAIENVKTETIERCAQAVWDAGGDNVEFHCAAIRALKDKP